MIALNFEKIKSTKAFTENIRWDVTPKIFLEPSSGRGTETVDLTYGYMLYVDMVDERPDLAVMVLKPMISKSAGYTHDIPDDMLRECMQCGAGECISGMYPITERLEQWLKNEFSQA
jgi:hypothetical protein